MVLSPTHSEANHLTQTIREEFKQRGMITGRESEVVTLNPIHLTEGERSDSAFLKNDDVIIFHQNAKGHRKGERIQIKGTLPRDITSQSARFAVYRPGKISLAKGDRVRMTAGGQTKDGKHRFNNGTILEFAGLTKAGDLKFSNGMIVDRNFGHLAQGFVSTSHASQGRTVDHVFIAESAESLPAASRQQLYVSASRGRKSAQIYTDSKEDLKAAIHVSAANESATETFRPLDQQALYQRQRKQNEMKEPVEKQRRRELSHER